jgi:hypothetical protein
MPPTRGIHLQIGSTAWIKIDLSFKLHSRAGRNNKMVTAPRTLRENAYWHDGTPVTPGSSARSERPIIRKGSNPTLARRRVPRRRPTALQM